MPRNVYCPRCGARHELADVARGAPAELECVACMHAFTVKPHPLTDAPFTDINTFMGTLRALLAEPDPDATSIVLAIKDIPNAHDREVASRYAWEHFQRIGRRDDVAVHAPRPPESPMRFDPETRVLASADGAAIKELCCPVEKRWSELEVLDAQDMARACADCKRNVFDTRGMNAGDVRRIVASDPSVCLHVDERHGNVVFATAPSTDDAPEEAPIEEEIEQAFGLRGRVNSWARRITGGGLEEPTTPREVPLIATASSVMEVNLGAALGLRPLVKRLADLTGDHYMQVWQNTRTHEVMIQADPRHAPMPLPYDEWEVAVPAFTYGEQGWSPFGAYLVPADLEPGSSVRLERVLMTPEMRLAPLTPFSTYLPAGTWDGADIQVTVDNGPGPTWVG
jgi:hypothetical protein